MAFILRVIGGLSGVCAIFVGLMPSLGLISGWDNLLGVERLICSIIGGGVIGYGALLILFCGGLLDWIGKKDW